MVNIFYQALSILYGPGFMSGISDNILDVLSTTITTIDSITTSIPFIFFKTLASIFLLCYFIYSAYELTTRSHATPEAIIGLVLKFIIADLLIVSCGEYILGVCSFGHNLFQYLKETFVVENASYFTVYGLDHFPELAETVADGKTFEDVIKAQFCPNFLNVDFGALIISALILVVRFVSHFLMNISIWGLAISVGVTALYVPFGLVQMASSNPNGSRYILRFISYLFTFSIMLTVLYVVGGIVSSTAVDSIAASLSSTAVSGVIDINDSNITKSFSPEAVGTLLASQFAAVAIFTALGTNRIGNLAQDIFNC